MEPPVEAFGQSVARSCWSRIDGSGATTWMPGVALLVACLTLCACDQRSAPPAEPTPVRAVAVQLRDLDDTAALTGEIRSRFESDRGFRGAVKVGDLPVAIGATVSTMDLLARLDDQD